MVDQNVQSKGFHYAWLILIGCCCCGAGGMALTISLMGVYLIPASTGMGLTPTEFTLWSATLGIVQLFSFPIWGQLMRKHLRACFLVGVICEVAGIFLFTVVNSVIGIIGIGVLLGIALPMTFFLPIPALTSTWFAPKHRAKMLGIGMAFSGVGTFIWAPLFSGIVDSMGYVNSYIINAVLAAILLLPWAFLFRFSPEEKGLKPYGWDPEEEKQNSQLSSAAGTSAISAMKNPAFWMLFVAVAFAAIGMGFNNCQRPMAAEMLAGTDLAAQASMIGAFMISAAAAGNVIGKIIYGFLADRFGLKSTTVIFGILFLLSFLLWAIFPGSMGPMYVGAFLLGTHNGITSVGFPAAARQLFGGFEYEKIWSRLSMASAIIGGFSTTIVTAVAASIGSYTSIFYFGLGMVLVVVVILTGFAAMTRFGKVKWDHNSDSVSSD